MYVICTRNKGGSQELMEMTADEYRKEAPLYYFLRRVDPAYARKWVKDDGFHSTPLFVDFDGKVRYATG